MFFNPVLLRPAPHPPLEQRQQLFGRRQAFPLPQRMFTDSR